MAARFLLRIENVGIMSCTLKICISQSVTINFLKNLLCKHIRLSQLRDRVFFFSLDNCV